MRVSVPIRTNLIFLSIFQLNPSAFFPFSPSPPSESLTTRLSESAKLAGSNLSSAVEGIQLVVSDASRALGIPSSSSSSSPSFASLNTEKFLKVLRLQDVESLAQRLGVSKDRSKDFSKALDFTQARAEDWRRNNVKVMGWTGSLLASSASYILVFGTIGLLGLINRR